MNPPENQPAAIEKPKEKKGRKKEEPSAPKVKKPRKKAAPFHFLTIKHGSFDVRFD